VSTLIYLGMIAIVSTGMFAWGLVLFHKAQKLQDTTPPSLGASAKRAPFQQAEDKSNLTSDDKQSSAAGGIGQTSKHEEAA